MRAVSLWLPCFATDRQRRRREAGGDGGPAPLPSRPRPLVTAARAELVRSVVAADALAAAAGIAPGHSLANARALVPGLDVRPADARGDAEALARLADWCQRYTPWVAIETDDAGNGAGLWLDIAGCAHLFGGEEALIGDLVRRLGAFGYGARAGIADTAGAAWAVARFAGGDGAVVAPGGEGRALMKLPAAALRLAPAMVRELDRLGLRLVGDLDQLARAALRRRFGPQPGLQLDRALGRAAEPIAPRLAPAAHQARLLCPEPIAHADGIAAGLGRLLRELCQDLEAAGQGARRVELALYRVDGAVERASVGTSRPSRDVAAISRLFAQRLERLDPGFGVEIMVLTAPRVEPAPARQEVLATGPMERNAPGAAGDLSALIDRLGNRLGFAALVRPAPRASHWPERAVMTVPAAEDLPTSRAVASWPALPPRPLRLLARPEPVTVEETSDAPLSFAWRGLTRRARRLEGPERIAGEWWRDAARARDYVRFEDEEGRRYWLYREVDAPSPSRWYLHGLFG